MPVHHSGDDSGMGYELTQLQSSSSFNIPNTTDGTTTTPVVRQRAQRRNSVVILRDEQGMDQGHAGSGDPALAAQVRAAAQIASEEDAAATTAATGTAALKKVPSTTLILGTAVLNDLAMQWLCQRWLKIPGVTLVPSRQQPRDEDTQSMGINSSIRSRSKTTATNPTLSDKNNTNATIALFLAQQRTWTVVDVLRLAKNDSPFLQYRRPSLRLLKQQQHPKRPQPPSPTRHKPARPVSRADEESSSSSSSESSSSEDDSDDDESDDSNEAVSGKPAEEDDDDDDDDSSARMMGNATVLTSQRTNQKKKKSKKKPLSNHAQ